MDLVTFNFVAAWALSAVGIVFLLLVVGYKGLLVYIRDPDTHYIPCFMLFLWAGMLVVESVNGWEGESLYISCFTISIVTISLYHNFLQMEFPEESESPDLLFYLVGCAHLIFLGGFVISEITKNVAENFDLTIEPFILFKTMDQDGTLEFLITFQSLAISSIFIYYLIRYAPDRASKQREEKRAQDEKVEQEKRLQREAEVQRRKAEAQRRTQNRALWSRKKEGMRTIAESVFPKIVSFEYDPYIDRLEIETNEQELHYDDVLKRNLPGIRKEMQKDYEDRGVSRTSYVSRYGRSRRYGDPSDDDINSVDGGPPSEAYDDASDDDG
tara:strand:+ start:140 stop:1120 length:981 start_codon:yes stop_codon:yes gene_type:complete